LHVRLSRDDPLFIYIVNQGVHWFIVGLTLPVMILYLTSKGLDLFQAGLVISVYSGTIILLELPTGGLSDSVGRKKVYQYSLAISLISGTVLLLATGFEMLLAGYALYGLARALSSGSMDAWFVDEFRVKSPEGDLQKALAKANFFIPLGLGAGSLIGGLLPMLAEGLTSSISWMNLYSGNVLAMVLMIVVQMFLTSVLVREAGYKGEGNTIRNGFRSLPKVISDATSFGVKDRFTLTLLLSMFFMGFGLLAVELLWQPRAISFMDPDEGSWVLGVLAAGYFFASAVGNLLAVRLVPWFGRGELLLLTLIRAVTGITLIVLAWQSGLLAFAFLYLLLYLVIGTSNSPHAAVFNARIPSERRSTLMSFESLMIQAGGLIGAPTVGWLADRSGITSAWTVAGAILLLSSSTYGYLWIRQKRR